ncbi:hypothetical protein ANCCAN_30449 [Ancylostoma caninum]|uniref:Uncharacterized protein n=1 Tax=Ancylostoma caninum TaxID=29170 RepID=A0A368EW08_ANCCA|nr:hypothetical protein ANCCAN_30449 [Ancylostoma caninum]
MNFQGSGLPQYPYYAEQYHPYDHHFPVQIFLQMYKASTQQTNLELYSSPDVPYVPCPSGEAVTTASPAVTESVGTSTVQSEEGADEAQPTEPSYRGEIEVAISRTVSITRKGRADRM